MKNRTIILLPSLVLFMAFATIQAFSAPKSGQRLDKIDPKLQVQIFDRQADAPVAFLIEVNDQPELIIPEGLSKAEKGALVYAQLQQHASQSQREIISQLEGQGVEFRPFSVTNAILVKNGDAELIKSLAQQNDVRYLHANLSTPFDEPQVAAENRAVEAISAVEWGVEKIGAPLIWSQGITGTGAVVAGQDTGYNWDHEALRASYRGWDGVQVDHNYNWHDAINEDLNGNGTNPCGFGLTAPCDDISSYHGTHTMGTMVGKAENAEIGIAPGAAWIACRNMEEGDGRPETYIACFEWFLAPTDLNGLNPNPSLAPDVINNSWGCPVSEGCNSSNFNLMEAAVNNLRAAGIVVVTSAGNTGTSCSTVSSPAAIFDGVFSVGATTNDDDIASFSSRGPVTVDGSGRMKPNITAPGVGVRSSTGTTSYRSLSGTSMAGPHVAGAVGLMVSAYPPIAGEVDLIEQYLEETAEFIGVGACGGDETFNNTFGHGRINVHRAIEAIWNLDIEQSIANITINDSISSTQPSALITYTIQLTKTGPGLTFSDVQLEQQLPSNASFISASQPISLTDTSLSWSIGDLGPAETVALNVTLQVTSTENWSVSIAIPASTVSAQQVPAQEGSLLTKTISFFENRVWLPNVSR